MQTPNGSRYPLVGGTRQRLLNGTNYKPRKLPENAQTPTSRVHALLGGDRFAAIYKVFHKYAVSEAKRLSGATETKPSLVYSFSANGEE